MTDLVTVGWLTTDDIVLESGVCRMAVPGGGALYSAIGAQVWTPSVGIHAPAGRPHVERSRREIAARGLDVSGIAAAEGNGLELWLLHESDIDKRQVPKLASSTPEEMDAARGPLPPGHEGARGFHVAPQGPESSLANVQRLHGPGRVVTMDILSDEMIDAGRYRDLRYLAHVDAFLPSETEIVRIWRPTRVEDWIAATAREHRCHLAAKLGKMGSLVAEAGTGRVIHVPAFAVEAVDTTGAGDAYCGGFLAGLAAGRPVAECAAMGTVSASYVVAAVGALATARPAAEERDRRLRSVLGTIRQT